MQSTSQMTPVEYNACIEHPTIAIKMLEQNGYGGLIGVIRACKGLVFLQALIGIGAYGGSDSLSDLNQNLLQHQ